MQFCPNCGTEVTEDTRYCPECGRPFMMVGQVGSGESKNKKKIAGIIVACVIAIIVIIVLFSIKPWERTYTLSVTVTPSQAGFVLPSDGEYKSGTKVTLTAFSNTGYTFDHWSGTTSETTSTITITIDSDKSLTAHFEITPTAPEVLFSDDFSDESSGWVTSDDDEGQVAYTNGCFYIKDFTYPEATNYGNCQRYFTDFILEVETWLVSGTDTNWHSVFFRTNNEGNTYACSIGADGYYLIDKEINSEIITLAGPTYSSYINQGVGAVNLIHIECIGSSLSLSVNGHELANVTDSTFSGGDIALAANALSGTFTEVAFDNIVVSEPSGTVPTVPAVLFSDDFSDESSGWVTSDDEYGQVAYVNGYLHIKDYTYPEATNYGNCQRYFTDFILEVETWLVGGTDDNWHMVPCRLQDNDNYYDFGISADGYYDIVKFVNADKIALVSPTYTPHINQGVDAVNLIHIECIGSSLSLSVNGHELANVTDTAFSGGDIALSASALGGTFTEVAFDNIVVREPSDTIPTAPEVLFSDDFSDESSGWVTYDEYDGEVTYSNGCLYIKDYTTPEEAMYGESQRYFTDFILEVETWLVSGTDDNWQSVLCRAQDDGGNYYDFGISADGYYEVLKFVNENRIVLVSPTYSSYLNQGVGAVNLIHIECIGSSLSFAANGHLLWEGIDTSFTGGDIYLMANSLAGTFTEVAFDNIVISEP